MEIYTGGRPVDERTRLLHQYIREEMEKIGSKGCCITRQQYREVQDKAIERWKRDFPNNV